MIKGLRLLMKAGEAAVEATLFEHTGVVQVEQRLAEAMAAHGRARHALATAAAHAVRERRALDAADERIADLEVRARAAVAQGRLELAEEAARAIAVLENERDARDRSQAEFDLRLERLRLAVEDGAVRLAALRRGLKAARASQALQRLTGSGGRSAAASSGALEDAEAMLQRLEQSLATADDVEQARGTVARTQSADDLVERLAAAGCGPATGSTSALVMARLRAALPTLPTE